MEMAQTDNGNKPKSYSLNMFKDFVPMSVFSESNQGSKRALSLSFFVMFVCMSSSFSYR